MPRVPKSAEPSKTAPRMFELDATTLADFEWLKEDEAARTGQSPDRVGAPLIRRLIREERIRRTR